MEKFISYIKKNYIEVALISAITIVALILRLIVLKNYGDLWLDELYSWYFAKQKFVFGTVWELLKQDLHVPLYFIILHFWTKIFGQSDVSMHLCTIFVSIPLIPLSYYLMKNLFNKTTGYFAAIMFAINTFCIYYSTEVRFYGLVFVLALLSAFYFVKMLENLDKKYIIGFIISHSLLLYTFSATPLLTFFYGIVGGLYLLKYKRELLKKYCNYFYILIAIALPVVIFNLCNIIIMHFNICSFNKDIYIFDWKIIFDMLENYFSSQNIQICTGALNFYTNMFEQMHNGVYTIFVFVPIFIGLGGLLKSVISKNEKLYLMLLPSILFLITVLLLASVGSMSLLTKYTSIIYPVIISAACYGLSQIGLKVISWFIFSIYVVLNLSFVYVQPMNVYNLHRQELGDLTDVVNKVVNPKDDDLFLIPYSGSKVMRYIPKGKLIHFFADDALLLKDGDSLSFYFDRKYKKNVHRDNVKEELQSCIGDNSPFVLYHIILRDKHLDKMKKGQKFIFISYRNSFIMPIIQNWEEIVNSEFYDSVNLFSFLMAKIARDTVQIADLYLKPIKTYNDKLGRYSIYVYEKQ